MSWTKCGLCGWMLEGGKGSQCTNDDCESNGPRASRQEANVTWAEAALARSRGAGATNNPRPPDDTSTDGNVAPPLPQESRAMRRGNKRIRRVTPEQFVALKRAEAEVRARRKAKARARRYEANAARRRARK